MLCYVYGAEIQRYAFILIQIWKQQLILSSYNLSGLVLETDLFHLDIPRTSRK